MESYISDFINRLKKENIELNTIQIDQFKKYADLLIEWNNKINLTAIKDYEGIYSKHFYDCLLPSFEFKYQGSLCDVGSGAGFPSIVLKIVYPNLKVTIVEPLGKRCTFLRLLVSELNLSDVQVINQRSEDFVKIKREAFDLVSARAVANLCVLAELCIPLVKKDGYFIAMKGSNGEEEVKEAKFAINELGCKLFKILTRSYDDNNRVNIIYQKVNHTKNKYPRMFAQIKKSPLRGGKDE